MDHEIEKEIRHKQELLNTYKENLRKAELENASREFDMHLRNSIDEYKNTITSLEVEIRSLLTKKTKKQDLLKPVPYPLQKYDDVLKSLFSELRTWNGDKGLFTKVFLTSLCSSCKATHAIFATRDNDKWKIIGENSLAEIEINEFMNRSGTFSELMTEAGKQIGLTESKASSDFDKSCLFHSISSGREIICIYDVKSGIEFDKGFEIILESILEISEQLTSPDSIDILELKVNNNLREAFGYVPDKLYDRQFSLFKKLVADPNITLFFEPIIYINPTTPGIFGWEALARDKRTGMVPVLLFDTAELWGTRFILELDMHFLKKAIQIYVREPDNPNQYRRKNSMKLLTINVHPNSLIRTRYYEVLKEIQKDGRMPMNLLYLEISEKAPIPITDDWDGETNIIDNFRVFVKSRFRIFDVHLAVDDYGVGFASPSRISRLGPKIVKIDRDALLDDFGNFTFESVINLTLNLPGEIDTVVEGFDVHSKFSLRRLYKLGVRYLQGHKYAYAQEKIDDRLPKEIVEKIKKDLSDLAE
jgi:EAL domain-containing protein (putative c-di-GMP-specific phosphodiesterase class I)/arsenate reductase-like glutaredoxin family protein